jgi:hypothetical protein
LAVPRAPGPVSRIALTGSFSAEPRASGPIFMFCASRLVFGSIEGVGSNFHVLHSLNRFRRYRWRRLPFSYFALPNSFSVLPSVMGLIFMFCATGLILDGTKELAYRVEN